MVEAKTLIVIYFIISKMHLSRDIHVMKIILRMLLVVGKHFAYLF